ncbi:hypothetical protein VWN77_10865, partial [Campylobacter coli]
EYELENLTFTQEKKDLLLASLRLKLGILGNSTPDELELPIAKNLQEYLKNNPNLLIKGNNLLALHSLKKLYVNKIKLIYIDPP